MIRGFFFNTGRGVIGFFVQPVGRRLLARRVRMQRKSRAAARLVWKRGWRKGSWKAGRLQLERRHQGLTYESKAGPPQGVNVGSYEQEP